MKDNKKLVHLLEQMNQKMDLVLDVNELLLKSLLLVLAFDNHGLAEQLGSYLESLYEGVFEPDVLERLCHKK